MEIPWSTPGKTKATQLTANTAKDNIEKLWKNERQGIFTCKNGFNESPFNFWVFYPKLLSSTGLDYVWLHLLHVSQSRFLPRNQTVWPSNDYKKPSTIHKSETSQFKWTAGLDHGIVVLNPSISKSTIALSRAIRNSRKHTQAKSTPHDIYTTKTQFQQFNTS